MAIAREWRDTRDITADGHTKGSIDRKALRSCAGGTFEHVHAELYAIALTRRSKFTTQRLDDVDIRRE